MGTTLVEELHMTDVEHPLLSFADLGECDEHDVSEQVHEILAAEVDAAIGWSVLADKALEIQ